MSSPAIYLIPPLQTDSSGRTRESAGSFVLPYSTLLRMGFAWPEGHPFGRWALTPPFHPYPLSRAVYLCGTFPEFTLAGISPASCPAEPGLSSRALRRRPDLVLPVKVYQILLPFASCLCKITACLRFKKQKKSGPRPIFH